MNVIVLYHSYFDLMFWKLFSASCFQSLILPASSAAEQIATLLMNLCMANNQ